MKGQIGITAIITTATIASSVIGSFFTVQITVNEKINEVQTNTNNNIAKDRERLATLEEAIATIKTGNEEMRSDIKEILKAVK